MLTITDGLSSGQVLQRTTGGKARTTLTVTGTARGALTATVQDRQGKPLAGWNRRTMGKKAGAKTTVELRGLPTGGPYTLILTCGEDATARVSKFLVGDVWILAGQSNMQGVGNIAGAPPKHPLIRSLTMGREWMQAMEPLHLTGESPDPVHSGGNPFTREQARRIRKNATKGTGPGLHFAHEMVAANGVPQGLICTAHGGTSMQQWAPQPKGEDGELTLYGSLLASVRATGQPVAGVLWYQGESDAQKDQAALYTSRMRTLVSKLRRALRQPNLPWIIVQIASVYGPRDAAGIAAWNSIQDQQRLLPKVIRNLGVVTAIDLTLDDRIHITGEGHAILGRRLALEARRLVHREKGLTAPPSLARVHTPRTIRPANPRREAGGLVIEASFRDVAGGLRSGDAPRGFALVDEKGNDLQTVYNITLSGDTARVHISDAPRGSRLVYGLGCTPVCNLTDARGHAVPVFGPQPLGPPRAELPYITQWITHPPMESNAPLDALSTPPADLPRGKRRSYCDDIFKMEGFVNEHTSWSNHAGLAFFTSELHLPEPMRLEFLMGYDGPFRLWIDERPIFTDMDGVNPCLPDESAKRVRLAKGSHRLVVGMDINRGQAWGFFLRMVRLDVPLAQRKSGKFIRPTYTCG